MDAFIWMLLSALTLSGIISPLVHILYRPSSRAYLVHKKRTIQNAKRNAEFPVLVCIYNEDNVPTILHILEASNPTKESPIVIYLLHLVELMGRATPLFIAHKPQEKLFGKTTSSDHIINSFKIFEKQNYGRANVQPYTTMTPLATAHEDVCTLAVEKKTTFIIIPFHKQWNIDGTTHSSKWRSTNKKILDKAPCSVGILIDRVSGLGKAKSALSSLSSYSIGVIFLGGADDREALCYAMRMAEHTSVQLAVHQLVPINNVISNVIEKRVDGDVINGYRLDNKIKQHSSYKEHVVKDSVEIVSVIKTLNDAYDLILVGRRHENYLTLLSALTVWNEYPELGFFGDLFASPDFKGKASVLVMQQHSFKLDVMPDSPEQSRHRGTDFESSMLHH